MYLKSKKQVFLTSLTVLSLLYAFAFFSSKLRPWEEKSLGPVTLLQEIVYPVEYVFHVSSSFVSSTWNNYFYLTNAAKENKILREELGLLKTRQLQFDENIQELDRYRKLLEFTKKYDGKMIAAQVVGSPSLIPFQSLRVNRGRLDGVKVGMPVVTTDGVAGRVLRSGIKFSDIQLITDSNFNIDVLLQRTRVRGLLAGSGNQDCTLGLNRRSEIRIGDTVVSSGVVGSYPKGIPVGYVKRISYASDHVSQSITVEPWVDYRKLEEVFILQKEDQDVQKITETAGTEWLSDVVERNEQGK